MNSEPRPHQINFMDDGFSEEKRGASERIIRPTMLISQKNGANKEATN